MQERRRQLRRDMTKSEKILWDVLRNKKLKERFHRQFSVDEYVIDFYCPELKLAIEVEGNIHDLPEQKIYHRKRQEYLETFGIKLFYFRNEEILEELDNVIRKIETEIGKLRNQIKKDDLIKEDRVSFNLIDKEHLEKLGDNWLEKKKERIKNLLEIAEPDEALYRELMISLGYPKNKIPFLQLALILPYKELKQLNKKEIIEEAMLYRSGLSDKSNCLTQDFDLTLRMIKTEWSLKGVRPINNPQKRIKNFSTFIHKTLTSGLFQFFIERIKEFETNVENKKEAVDIVKQIMSIDGIGLDRKREMFFNIILPFYLLYAEQNNLSDIKKFLKALFEYHPALKENSTIKKFDSFIKKQVNFSYRDINAKQFFGIHRFVSLYLS